MNFLNSASYEKHMSPEHNYLEDLKNQGIVVCEEVEEEESFTEPTLIVVEKESIGRPRESRNIPDFLKRTVAVLANTSDERQEDIGAAFGIKQEMVSQFKNGKTSAGTPEKELKDLTNQIKAEAKTRRETIEDVALMRTLSTLNILTDDDIECLGAKDKADVAVKLSKVAANMRDKVINNDNRTLLIIKAPPVKESLDGYSMIEVG